MPARLPQSVLELRGRTHQTKEEKEERRASEPKLAEVKRVRYPGWLPEHLRSEFNEISRELIRAGLFVKVDRDVLSRYLMTRDAWIAAHAKALEALDADDPKVAGAWARVAKTYFSQCHDCASGMGLTISSRCRLVVPKPPEDPAESDPLSKLLEGRQRCV